MLCVTLAKARVWMLAYASMTVLAGEGSLLVPHQIKGTEIVHKQGAQIPTDVVLTDHTGKKVQVGDYLHQGKPLVLTLGYYECPMLCSLVLNGLTDVMKNQSLKLGQDYHVLSVSINPNEKPDLADTKRVNYLKSMNLSLESPWAFTVGSHDEVKRLADSVGFGYRYDKTSGEYVHSAGIFIVSPEGILSRTLYGIAYRPADFKMSLVDASHGKVGSLMDRIILSCFHYQPDSHRYGVYIFGVMRVAGLLTVILLGIFLFVLRKRERRGRHG